jgi:hypothetical protein
MKAITPGAPQADGLRKTPEAPAKGRLTKP